MTKENLTVGADNGDTNGGDYLDLNVLCENLNQKQVREGKRLSIIMRARRRNGNNKDFLQTKNNAIFDALSLSWGFPSKLSCMLCALKDESRILMETEALQYTTHPRLTHNKNESTYPPHAGIFSQFQALTMMRYSCSIFLPLYLVSTE